ncbi:MAG TPA: BrnT family toxin [Thermoanaerobaculia bacterium]|nr:BrnT family toxin [Thermoanaerobaculia bacterium]
MEYEWDEEKAAANLRKYGVDFTDAALVLEDEHALTLSDLYSESEERFVTTGRDPQGRLLVVIYTWREERIRLISAREATRRERRDYEKDL